MKIQLSEHFTYRKLLKFTFPSIVMMIFTSIYSVVDGFFVSNFAGKTAFTAVNFVMPVIMILGAAGFMLGTGGSAIIGKTMGEGKPEEAKRQFSMITYVAIGTGIVLAILGMIFIRPIIVLLGAEGEMLELGVLYARILFVALPASVLQYLFQSFFIVAEKPDLGLKVSVLAGVANMILDALFVGAFSLGIVGAAVATVLSQCVGGILPLLYFSRKNSSSLQLVKAGFDGRTLKIACLNGSSEFVSNITMSLVGMLYNTQLLRYAGNDGVAAYGVIMYVNLIFLAIFIGYSMGSAPIVSYHYGANHCEELKNLRKKGLAIVGIFSIIMFVAGEVLARPLSLIFASYDGNLLAMTIRGFVIYSFSFLRTLVFQVAAVLILPLILDLDGIWISVVAAEFLAALVSLAFLIALQKKYKY